MTNKQKLNNHQHSKFDEKMGSEEVSDTNKEFYKKLAEILWNEM